jgi:hypothetical protein
MTEAPTPQSSQEAPQVQDTSATAAAPDAASQQTAADPAQAAKPEKPEWLFDDALFDPDKGVKLDELGARAKQLFDADAERARIAEERKANTPEKPEDYKFEAPADLKLPEGFEIDGENPMWGVLQAKAHKLGMTNDEYGEIAKDFVGAMAAEHKRAMDGVKAAQTELFKQLGTNGPSRVEAVKKWMSSTFGDQVGKQLQNTLFTPDIVKAFEHIQRHVSGDGATNFNGSGREGGNGKIEGWEKMSFEQRWLHARNNA